MPAIFLFFTLILNYFITPFLLKIFVNRLREMMTSLTWVGQKHTANCKNYNNNNNETALPSPEKQWMQRLLLT